MVKPLNRSAKEPFAEHALDIETDGFSSRVLCICDVGADGTRIHAPSLGEFFVQLMPKLSRVEGKVRVWAHYGGTFDTLVLLNWLLANGWELLRGSNSAGGSLWSADFRHESGVLLELRDTARLFVESLAKLGDVFGLPKLERDRSNLAKDSYNETVEYCFRDCEITLLIVDKLKAFLRTESGQLVPTIAGCASRIVRATCVPRDAWGWNATTDEIGSRAYYGGRVERFAERAGRGSVFDVNSMYPWAMTGRLPTRYRGRSKVITGNGCEIVRARVSVPRGTLVGPLPVRATEGALKGRLCFPTGTFEGWWHREELEAAIECTLDLRVVVLEVHRWDDAPWLEALMERWYATRRAAKSEPEKLMFKLLLNSVSGKLIEKGEQEWITTAGEVAHDAEIEGKRIVLYPTKERLLYGVRETIVGTLRHGAAAATVLARSRAKLLRALTQCARAGELYYCDTDSLYGTVAPDDVHPSRLGAWKHEADFNSAEFLASKLYAVWTDSGVVVKCKGYPKTVRDEQGNETRLPPEQLWNAIRAGEALRGERTVLMKGLMTRRNVLGEKSLAFRRVSAKRQRREGIDKRCFENDTSRPWTIEELNMR